MLSNVGAHSPLLNPLNTHSTSVTPSIIQRIANASFYLLNMGYSLINSALNFSISYLSNPLKKKVNEAEMEELHKQQVLTVRQKFNTLINNSSQVVLEPKPTTFLYRPRNLSSVRLDLRQFNQVINIDTKNKIAHVQGLISFYDLLEATLKKGLRPKVIPELRGITIGGAISGLAVESSSFKHGLFHRSVIEMEILTGAGAILTCSANKNKDLFLGMPNSYGTLGYILSAKIELVPAKPYVDVTYLHLTHCAVYFQVLKTLCEKPEDYDFIDGAIFSSNEMVIVLGKETEVPSHPPASDYIKDKIYYKEINHKSNETFDLKDYIWRWDRDSFWSTKDTPLQHPFIKKYFGSMVLRTDRLNVLNRFLNGFMTNVIHPFSPPKVQKEELIQDVGVPIDQCASFLDWFSQEIGIYPLFICPVKKEVLTTPLWQLPEDQIYCDVGFFGRKITNFEPGHYNRKVEEKLIEIGGRKSLYSKTYYSEKIFKKLYYGNGAYEDLQNKYNPYNIFPSLFDKCVRGR